MPANSVDDLRDINLDQATRFCPAISELFTQFIGLLLAGMMHDCDPTDAGSTHEMHSHLSVNTTAYFSSLGNLFWILAILILTILSLKSEGIFCGTDIYE